MAYGQALSRVYWRGNHKYVLPKHCGITPALQCIVGFSAVFYLLNYQAISHHKNASTIGEGLHLL